MGWERNNQFVHPWLKFMALFIDNYAMTLVLLIFDLAYAAVV
jgi:hypothetical protein